MAVKKSRTMMARPSNESTPSIIAEESGIVVQQQTINDSEFRPIDRAATVQAVKSFFSDRECYDGYNYQELKRMSGAWGELKSPALSATGGGSGIDNGVEQRFIKHAECLRAVQAVNHALEGCDRMCRDILVQHYIKNEPVRNVRDALHISGNATWSNLDKRACYQFAQCMEYAIDLYKVNRGLVPPLQIFL
ncbi:hypothetical protein [Limosilactobacillus sp.]|jgi:hypothetical protein|uniref:hypothetical protein n=1 Tax=Limosilactobacillus TaxID=2742598 RepID=UPI00258CFD57|nr:hypothetical protein [Limosilactobacillus sp.]MCC6096976.1 hypothetical protein [Limosilactobacillus sp.]